MNEKENTIIEFKKMIEASWTYAKMTDEEKEKWARVLESAPIYDAVKGTWGQRWNILNGIYHAFLVGIGYTDWQWREDDDYLPF